MTMYYKLLPLVLVVVFAFKWMDTDELKNSEHTINTTKNEVKHLANKAATFDEVALSTYETLNVKTFSAPSLESFKEALKGFTKMKKEGLIKKEVLTIIDFSLSSTQKRMWIINMVTNEVMLQTVVSHGRNSGSEFAQKFSNTTNSFMSSIGFYKTGESYTGKHGFSLRLDGLDKGFNDNARNRAVVIHGADYASEHLAKRQGRLGRSLGCPAVPLELRTEIINMIKEESCLFIYYPNQDYLKKSSFLA
ncbi:murein L,D-transpeptidase catalytic domain family protein [Flavobacterium sp. JP2137]|uniref:murein L,D-transpeptidase catalytic domain family protein n=1 Tax=Flavobacterium sp. JP2137 TaxID=3414510 RepID=UPI003D2FC39B